MDQKRFLTAVEVFQLFGVDAQALNALVESGDVTALADRGSFKYRSEDFLRLVQAGKLSPRTAGEMFEVDSKGDVPFLKIKGEDQAVKFDEDVSFIELDEAALNEQASQNSTTPQTPVIPEKWFDDLSETEPGSKKSDTQDEIDTSGKKAVAHEQGTEHELKSRPGQESDSDVQVLKNEGAIDYSEPDVAPSGSDSDVRLEGPISSAGMPAFNPQQKPDSDSDVRITTTKPKKSDSDVHIAKGKSGGSGSDSDVRVATAATAKPDSDSDVRIAKSVSKKPDSDSDVRIAKATSAKPDSDSDVTLMMRSKPQATSSLSSDSDSDVKIVSPSAARSSDSDSDVTIADSASAGSPVVPARSKGTPDSDSDVRMTDAPDSGIRLQAEGHVILDPSPAPTRAPSGDSIYDDDSGITVDSADSGIRLEAGDSGITLVTTKTDSDVAALPDADSGIAMESVHDSGISLDSATADSGLAVEGARTEKDIAVRSGDSGIALDSIHADSGIAMEGLVSDSGISLDDHRPDSGISLDASTGDSGISIESGKPDSGISMDAGDSGLGLESAGASGISLAKTDSSIAFDEEPSDASATLSDLDFDAGDSGHTQTLELSGEHAHDSGFDVSLAESERTMEMTLEDSDDSSAETPAKVVNRARSKGPEKADLSEAFDIDDSLEVEELDISEDLEDVPESEYSGEFAEAGEEVLEAEDEDFSAGEISVAEEDESEDLAPVSKARAVPREPAWGMLAVAPMICASLVMLATVTILWGGIVTMWTGGEAPGPAGMLISTLAGMWPS